MDVRSLEQLPVLLFETTPQLQLRGENPVFSQPSELDVAIQDNDFMACLREELATAMPAGPAPATMMTCDVVALMPSSLGESTEKSLEPQQFRGL